MNFNISIQDWTVVNNSMRLHSTMH